jgi:hypothetical protein
MFSNSSIVAYVLGLLTFVLAPRLLGGFFRLFNYGPPPRRDIYGLEHALLNMRLPPETMWLNMGYWKVFPPKENSPSYKFIQIYILIQPYCVEHIRFPHRLQQPAPASSREV